MAITYFGSASTPADNGSNSGGATVTPPGSMQAGDLVLLYGQAREAAGTPITIAVDGGQTWTDAGGFTDPPRQVELFWCVFDGTWDADPNIAGLGSLGFTGVMHVFRPTSAAYTWSVDTAIATAAFSAPTAGSPDTVIPGVTPVNASSVTIASWHTADDNNWTALDGTGWVQSGSDEYRNTFGDDLCSTYAHKIQTSVAATGDVQNTQSSLNRDEGEYTRITFAETAPAGRSWGTVIG